MPARNITLVFGWLFTISPTCYRYQPKLSSENAEIADWLLRLTTTNKRWGFGLCFLYLRNIKVFGWNHKRVYRIYRECELNLRIKPKRRIKRDKPEALSVPTELNQVWSMDFMSDSLSDDNPYSESLFRTLKYCPQWPSQAFKSLEAAREWVSTFVFWYNTEHKHSRIKFVTPNQRHQGEDGPILAKRKTVYAAAKKRHPNRWSGQTRNWEKIGAVALNPEREEIVNAVAAQLEKATTSLKNTGVYGKIDGS